MVFAKVHSTASWFGILCNYHTHRTPNHICYQCYVVWKQWWNDKAYVHFTFIWTKYICSSMSHRCWLFLWRVIFQNENTITNIPMLWLKKRKHNYSHVPFYFLSSTENCLLQPQRLNNKSSYITMNSTFCHFSMQNSTYSFLNKGWEIRFQMCINKK